MAAVQCRIPTEILWLRRKAKGAAILAQSALCLQVENSHSARMHVSSISSSGAVTFTQCLQGSSAWPEQPACAPLTTIAFM